MDTVIITLTTLTLAIDLLCKYILNNMFILLQPSYVCVASTVAIYK